MDRQTLEINKPTSLHQDNEFKKYSTIQSMSPADYVLKNTRDNKNNVLELATNQPNINFKDGHGINQSNLNEKNTIGKLNNFKGDANQLFPRPYLTIPYTGMGEHKVNNESILKSPHITSDQRASNSLSGVHIEQQYMPLVKNLKDNIQNPDNIIQENSKKYWIRGGIDTSQIVKDIDYFDRCIDDKNIRDTLYKQKPYLHSKPNEITENTNLMHKANIEENKKDNKKENEIEGVILSNMNDLSITNNINNVKNINELKNQ